jgi:hypothetical protein
MRNYVLSWVLLHFLWAYVEGQHEDAHCSLYMAESSIPSAGLGVYAARDFHMGERIVSANLSAEYY